MGPQAGSLFGGRPDRQPTGRAATRTAGQGGGQGDGQDGSPFGRQETSQTDRTHGRQAGWNPTPDQGRKQNLFAPGKNASSLPGFGPLPGFGGAAASTTPLGADLPQNGGLTGQVKQPAAWPAAAPKAKPDTNKAKANSLMSASLEEITGLLAKMDQRDAQRTAQQQSAPTNANAPGFRSAAPTAGQPAAVATQPAATAKPKSPLPKPNTAQAEDDLQPQYRLTGHAVAFEDEDRAREARAGADKLRKETEQHRYSSARDARDLEAKVREERKRFNARTDVDHRSGQERLKDKAYGGATGSEIVQQKMDDEYRKSREWLTKHGQEYARNEIVDHSSIAQDIQYLNSLDYSKLSDEELHKALGKAAQLADLAPISDFGSIPVGFAADMAAFRATKKDIDASDVSYTKKRLASMLNAVGILGATPFAGPLIDALVYESIGALISEQEKRDATPPNAAASIVQFRGR